MIMMTKARTSSIAGIKMLLVIPAVGFVFLAISAYREIPGSSVKQIVTVLESQNTVYGSELMPPPPPPPPVPKSESNGNIKVVTQESTSDKEEVPFTVVEQMPMFPGGDVALLNYIGENTLYPEAAKTQNVQGRVIVRFCVSSKGTVTQLSVLKGVSPELDAEAIRVVGTLPKFQPGRQSGKDVPVWYMVPITFTLN
jgi:TonB family protein